ncbi:MAG: epoxyqueuosine reductase QueH [Lachnospiraceae bacterium]|nr:epoxyqueuosine reductase QueH [Lachnospiraceae bacterium]
MNKINYNTEMESIISSLDGRVPNLLLHSCCAPCSSACLEVLTPHFNVTRLYYNPNITDASEYDHRLDEEKRYIETLNNNRGFDNGNAFHPISMIDARYEPDEFFEAVKGYEDCPEGGDRCFICYELRLREVAITAHAHGFDYFTTTLTLSPLKNCDKLNEIGQRLSKEYGVLFLPSDFKKKDGYKRSIQLSNDYDLYRQNYCGCIFSKR